MIQSEKYWEKRMLTSDEIKVLGDIIKLVLVSLKIETQSKCYVFIASSELTPMELT